jgi:hypothetical protein
MLCWITIICIGKAFGDPYLASDRYSDEYVKTSGKANSADYRSVPDYAEKTSVTGRTIPPNLNIS